MHDKSEIYIYKHMFVCVGVWVCGCVGVWVCGCVGGFGDGKAHELVWRSASERSRLYSDFI